MTNWQKIYKKLKEHGIDCYAVGVHQGKCTKPYVVIREAEQMPSFKSNNLGMQLIQIICIVPFKQYTKLEPLKDKVKAAMKELDFVKRTGFESVSTIDEDREATESYVEYKTMKRLKECER